MELEIDLDVLEQGIDHYGRLIEEMAECQKRVEAVLESLYDSWSGVHADKVRLRMGSLLYGQNNSLVRLREQAEGIHETLKRAQEGMNVQKNRCDHFPDMLASEHPAQSYPNVREGGNSRLFIDYDSSLQLIRWLESLLENELNPERVPQSQMGAWERMYECVEGGLYHSRKNLEEENAGAVRDLDQQYHRLENFRDSLMQYHMELDQLEKDLTASFDDQRVDWKGMEVRSLYAPTISGQEALELTSLGFHAPEEGGEGAYDWEAIAYALGKETLSEEETADLTDMLDRISRLPETEREYLIQLFFANCPAKPGAVDSFLSGYYKHLEELTEEARPAAERLYYQLAIRRYNQTHEDHTEIRNPDPSLEYDYLTPKLEKWLKPGYRLNASEIQMAKEVLNDYWGKGSGREELRSNNSNRRMAATLKMTAEEWEMYQRMNALDNKLSWLASAATNILDAIPFMDRLMDGAGEWMSEARGSSYLESSRLNTMAENGRTQNSWGAWGGSLIGQIGTYNVGSRLVQKIPGLNKAVGAGADKLAALPLLNRVGSEHINQILSGLAADMALDTIPETVDRIGRKESLKEIAAATSLNVLENLAWNIAGEGVLTWFEKGAGKVEGGSGTGKLSNVDARKWYLEHEAQIPDLIDKNLPIEEQAKQAFNLRNQFRTEARELMEDRALAESLYKSDPNLTWEQLIEKQKAKGYSGDDIYKAIIESSQRSRRSVNQSLGLDKE